MVTLLLDQTQLEIGLSAIERAAALHRGNVRVAREHITKVQLTDDPWTWVRGLRSPGTHIPGILAAGTWRGAGSVDFVMIKSRERGVVISLDGDPHYQRLIVTTRHGLALTQALRLKVTKDAKDVVDIAATGPIPVRKNLPPVIKPSPI